jgi:hypothetical protein
LSLYTERGHLTYAELALHSNGLTHFLRAGGLRRLDRYAIFIQNNARYVEHCGAGECVRLYYTSINSYLTPDRHHREGLKVCGLSAGWRWIRTIGPSLCGSTLLGQKTSHTDPARFVVEIMSCRRSLQANSNLFSWRCRVARRPIGENAIRTQTGDTRASP